MLVHHRRNERDIKHIRSGLLFTMARACHQSGGGGEGGGCLCEHFSPAARSFFSFVFPGKRILGSDSSLTQHTSHRLLLQSLV